MKIIDEKRYDLWQEVINDVLSGKADDEQKGFVYRSIMSNVSPNIARPSVYKQRKYEMTIDFVLNIQAFYNCLEKIYNNYNNEIIKDISEQCSCFKMKQKDQLNMIYQLLWEKIIHYIDNDNSSAFAVCKDDAKSIYKKESWYSGDFMIFDIDDICQPFDKKVKKLTNKKIINPCINILKEQKNDALKNS